MTVLVTKDVRKADRLVSLCAWAAPVLFPGLLVDILSSYWEREVETDGRKRRVYIVYTAESRIRIRRLIERMASRIKIKFALSTPRPSLYSNITSPNPKQWKPNSRDFGPIHSQNNCRAYRRIIGSYVRNFCYSPAIVVSRLICTDIWML